jgi:hypothetical protein
VQLFRIEHKMATYLEHTDTHLGLHGMIVNKGSGLDLSGSG